ncbi:MurR/RpiR family transcriptional regulator [Bordetella sp. FB-8]|uniref:MurR/RpiR family transcriptional regulator n=1 Tax=Bordetella sp. FB-8 TaxID=1159870 RepID=UPI000360AAB8|nr:MurR/RpiR family transcriptional regulator [Bordetella sp. FB-8]
MTANYEALVATIREKFPQISPQLQVGAGFLLDNPDEVAVLSMRKVAERAGVQPAALVRLAQSLGFPGWNELREIFVGRLRTRPPTLGNKARSLVKGGADNHLSRELALSQVQNLEAVTASNAERVVEAAKVLRKAEHVHVAGFRSCYPVAFGITYGYRLFRSSISLITGEAGTLEMQVRGIEKRHATVVISFAPYSIEAVRVAQESVARGAPLIAITDSAVSPIALNADQVLLFSHDSPSFFPSLVAASAVAEMLVAHLLALEGKAAVKRIEDAEAALHANGAYSA